MLLIKWIYHFIEKEKGKRTVKRIKNREKRTQCMKKYIKRKINKRLNLGFFPICVF
jgi:hypothetical protein